MKTKYYISFLLSLLLGIGFLSAQNESRLSIPELTALPGKTISLPIYVDNTVEIVAVQFSLEVPEGSGLDCSSATLTNRAADHTVTLRDMGNGEYLFMVFSPTNSSLKGRTGKLLTVDMSVSNDYEDNSKHDFVLKDVVLSMRDGTNGLSGADAGSLTMMKRPDLEVQNVQVSETAIAPSGILNVSWQVSNIGGLPTESGWTEQISLIQADGSTSFLGHAYYEDALEAGGTVSRQISLQVPDLPGLDGEVRVQVQIAPQYSTGESEAALGNNTATAPTPVTLGKQLTLTLPTGSIDETYGQPIPCTLARSGNRTKDETFSITATSDNRVGLPSEVTIPAGQSAVNFYIQLTDNNVLDNQTVISLSVAGNGYAAVAGQITIEDNEYPDLKLTASKSQVDEGETFQLTITATRAPATELEVSLSSEVQNRFTFPARVAIPVGQTSVTVDVAAKDDDIPSLTLSNAFTAVAPGYNRGEAIVVLEDNDIPVLELTLTPDQVSESVGPVSVAATLRRTGITNNKITVKLSDDSDGDVYYGTSTVEMAKGVEEVHFNLGPIDNANVDGDRIVNITAAVYISSCSCNAQGESAGVVSAQLTVLDDDGPALTLKASNSTVKEGDKVMLTVSRNTPTTEALTFTLSGDKDAMFEAYNHTITIPAGASDATVELTSKSNDVSDDSFTAVFTATAEGFSKGSCFLMVTDQTLPDARITAITAAQTEVEVGGTTNINIIVANDGAAVLPAGTPVTLYEIGTSRTLRTTRALAVNETETLTAAITLPTTIGSGRYYAVINESNNVKELNYNNNTSASVTIHTISPFTASVSTDKAVYKQGETVQIAGQLTGNQTAEQTVEVYIINDGARQTLTARTDATGAFTVSWTPYSTQSGHFIVGACFQGENLRTEMAAFDVYGLKRTNNDNITCATFVGEVYSGSIPLYNPGVLSLNHIFVEIIEKPESIQAVFSSIEKLEGGQTSAIDFNLRSEQVSPVGEYEHIKVRIYTDEGFEMNQTLYFYNQSPTPHLAASISSINTTMSMDGGSDYTFVISNTGMVSTGKIFFSLRPWMSTLTPSQINSMEPGESATVVLHLQPTNDMQLNAPITGSIAISCENGNGITLPYKVRPVSDKTGTLVVDVYDENLLVAAGSPHLEGAKITVSLPSTNEVVAEGITDSNGLFQAILPEGYYNIFASADQHTSVSNTITVAPGMTNPLDIFIAFKGIEYSYSVERVEIEDKYEVVTTVEYETRIPAPVVIVDFPEKIPYESQIVNISVTNKGLVAAYNVYVDVPQDNSHVSFDVLVDQPIAMISPQQSIFIPIKMTTKDNQEYESQKGITSGGTYYGNNNSDIISTGRNKVRRKTEMEEISDGCWRFTWTVAHDRRECNKRTGEWETVGTDYTSHTYYYGNCFGNNPGTSGWTSPYIYIPTWIPTYTPEPTPPGIPPTTPPTSTENRNNQSTGVFDGCTTDCEDAAAKAAAGCGAAAAGCGSAGFNPLACIAGLGAGCSGVHNLSGVVDCVLGGLGCIPGGWGCAAGAAGCAKSLYDEANACGRNRNNAPRKNGIYGISKSVSKENLEPIRILYKADSIAIMKVREILGDDVWDKVTGDEFLQIQTYLWNNMTDRGVIFSENRYEVKPLSISEIVFDSFLSRLDNTIKKESNLDYDFANVIDMQKLNSYTSEFQEYEGLSEVAGYSSIQELADSVVSYHTYLLRRAEEGISNSVCATITLQFKQDMVMTREAFRGTLEVYNGHDAKAMKDVKLHLSVTGQDGNLATSHEFEIRGEELVGFCGTPEIDSGWTLDAKATGKATILYIPSKYAAPTEPMSYTFGGTLDYIDPFTEMAISRPLAPITLTVNPSPELDLTYFMQRDVYGDDPLTEEVEPMEPAEFSLLINNIGYGDATNVRMVTNQPEIVDNEKGLLINFEILSAQLNGNEKTLALGGSVPTDFGTIPAHSQAYAQWWFQSSLLGHFTKYDVQATHVTSYGNPDLSLLNNVTIHELIRSIKVDDGEVTGFVVNDLSDAEDTPDMLYFSDGTIAEVGVATNTVVEKQGNAEYLLSITPSKQGWNYGKVTDPTFGRARLIGIRRQSDGKEINLRNFWQTDRTLRDGKDWLYENNLHFVDNFASSAEVYVLTFEPRPEEELEVASFEGLPKEGTILTEPLQKVVVNFNKPINAETFTREDITLSCQGNRVEAPISITAKSSTQFELDLSQVTAENGYYVLTVQTAEITDAEGFAGATGKSATWTQFVNATTLALSFNEAEVVYGESFTEPRVMTNSPAVPTYESSNPLVATVNPETGRVTIKAVGATTVRVNLEATTISDLVSTAYRLSVLQPEGLGEANGQTSVDITIPDERTMATFCYLYPIDFTDATDDCRAYVVSRREGNTVYCTEVAESKGGVGLLMYGKSGTYTFPVQASTYEPENLLVGTLAPTYVEETTDGLTNLGLKVNTFVPMNAGVVKPNKAYLPVILGIDVKALTVVLDNTDGMSTVVDTDRAPWYSISGLQMGQPARKGIYIHGGRKIVVK